MKLSANWIRDFVSPSADDRKMAEELTHTGIAVEGYYNSGDDLCYEAEVTTNRVDAMNHYGVAREVSAIFDLDLLPLAPKVAETAGLDFPIVIEDPQGCARFAARVIRGVKIASSPANIAHRLELIDQRPINNVADATNYVLNEIGHPTHAYDLDKLEGRIVVRRARDGEVLRTLDGVDRKLTKEDLIIADDKKALGIAGVMGGEASMITAQTRNVLIEAAWFDPATVRKTARRLGMHTDASHRFERGADTAMPPVAATRVAELVQQNAGGQVGPVIDTVARKIDAPKLQVRHSEVRRILGVDIADKEIERILRRLGFTVARKSAEVLDITIPTWRLDVEREIDVIEEIARVYGYLKIPNTLPSFAGSVVELPTAKKDARLRSTLLALGYNESLSTSFISVEESQHFGAGQGVVKLANPLSDEAGSMRSSLVPGLLAQVAYNLNRGNSDVRLFENGHVFSADGDKVREKATLAMVATGSATGSGVHGRGEAFTFFHAKGHVEEIVGEFDATGVTFDREVPQYFHPGRSARLRIGSDTVGVVGQVHPDVAAARKLKQEVFLAEFILENLYKLELRHPHYTPVAKYPAVERDFSMIFPEGTEFTKVRGAVVALKIAALKAFEPAEIFRGGSLAKDKYSMLVRARFQSEERTLRDDEVQGWSQQIVKAMETLGGTLRS